ncbi:heat shock protein 15 [Caenibius tardaugens NBRC 16725]|uniref:Heat shock protein 15 n=1 Tax=Caenibius tardaugens NBRC 16725 TaxID=1219035 RepID=U2YK84_9SPHN|nr:S4 domain-containing protein [Caenibius tardaugens]AZI35987.1 RNA-binding S4 domain-containing protein [Caenibius tardaugens NBRC 16725]GAD48950.1 heat shock protein 15 [Caenibius tardaugens NBRC 16725]
MRIDKLLWFLRFAKTRGLAQKWVKEGHIRRNSKRVERTDQPTAMGDILTLPLRGGVVVIELLALPTRRGPASEARECYRVLDGATDFAIAGQRNELPEGPEGDYRQ